MSHAVVGVPPPPPLGYNIYSTGIFLQIRVKLLRVLHETTCNSNAGLDWGSRYSLKGIQHARERNLPAEDLTYVPRGWYYRKHASNTTHDRAAG